MKRQKSEWFGYNIAWDESKAEMSGRKEKISLKGHIQ
jgi:hypothetical protein